MNITRLCAYSNHSYCSNNTNQSIPTKVDTKALLITGIGIAFGLLPNMIIIVGIHKKKVFQKPTFCLMANLASCDLLLGISILSNIFMSLAVNLSKLSPIIHEILCKVLSTFFLYWSFNASVQTLIIISIERYNAILRPTKKLTSKKAKMLCLLAWSLSFLISSPFLITATNLNKQCVAFKSHNIWVTVMMAILIAVQFVIPSAVMFTLYGLIICQLKKKDLAGRNQSINSKRLKRKTVYMLFTTTVAFIIFSIPWVASLLIVAVTGKFSFELKQDFSQPVLQSITEMGTLLLPLATVYNPVVYCIFNHNIRKLFFPYCYDRNNQINPARTLNSSRSKSESRNDKFKISSRRTNHQINQLSFATNMN
ncbi:Neuropeptide S receptor [Trichoplax sp. H2]|nr:Neuropeptide S receptor [Trichoplax sp. H2]|eukprot:RDD36379.1 Neuropeptide S receptor [Trichoplax sp. H2]